ncbi:MAG: Zinc ABC transporter, periplasmic-binding protein ZnuA [uncultured Sulfurovum sp.]|uniref:Zinc ABC transporter, periplasmic-binding protein ZnuA n=1 Tax=uncultured Sulfurovum sp. TaxID=269237 RepID=A0A6S6SH36_9BACT|nr:MAG: Zinc ABC transporter, periplasmic-binding protein ZnuA [uncultured Sulfurovum sp.]
MKKFYFLLLVSTLFSFAKTNVIVSIAPQKLFVEKIGAEQVEVTVMVKPGSSPHDYQPKPSQMKDISKASVYFAMGVEFENVWLEKFHNQNQKMLIVNSSQGVQKYYSHHNCAHGKHNHTESVDPHVWVDPLNVKVIAKNIYETLVELDNKNANFYKKNYEAYLEELDKLHSDIKEILKETPKYSTFMVFHPSWGYFAKRYTLIQLPVEVNGKEPKMKALVGIIERAKQANVHAIFTQPEFSDKASQNIANNLDIEVIKASPLAENLAENLKMLAKAIAKKK